MSNKRIAFIDKNNKLKVTGYAEQLPASELTYPDLDKLRSGLQKFGGNAELIHEYFEPISNFLDSNFLQGWRVNPEGLRFLKKNKNKKFATMFSSRGCVARCTFCQRATKGYRVYALNDLESHIVDLKEKYNVRAINLIDENSLSNRIQSYEMARIFKKHDIYWRCQGVRVTSVTYEDLKFYKEHNMLEIVFGIESGSQKILDIMEKKFTTKDVYNAILNCKKLGISTNTDGAFMIGMPGETKETVIHSAQFSASLKYLLGAPNRENVIRPFVPLAMAIPGTLLYEYSQQIGVIGKTLDEEEDYLIRISEDKFSNIINYLNKTNSGIKEVHYWFYLFQYARKKEYADLIIKDNKPIKHKLLRIYKKSIKNVFSFVVAEFSSRKYSDKNAKLLLKMKWLTLLSIGFLLSLSVVFLPKVILFPIIRMYANLRFYSLEKNHKVKKGKQKHNLFAEQLYDPVKNSRITENKIAKTNRSIERSLRKVVMENRKQMKPAITDEEKGLQILAQGQ